MRLCILIFRRKLNKEEGGKVVSIFYVDSSGRSGPKFRDLKSKTENLVHLSLNVVINWSLSLYLRKVLQGSTSRRGTDCCTNFLTPCSGSFRCNNIKKDESVRKR